ncbi:tRNA (adenosine(37)-N6)-dimethylallyltransferase, partial [Vannielia litorea]|uniref:tRNA (adenosine(37)-N6)-dimethylallyltransferase n=1 Tax=Vannielia litorea TaxID=1217970 RepID=UPI001BCCEAAA
MIDLKTLDAERPVLIAGPTASGKSALALEIAARAGGVIVNADALQVFANWRVLTARPSPEEEAATPHALYGHVPGDATYSVGHWLRDVAPLLTGTARPIITGGTGLYFTALTEGLADIPPIPPEVRSEADALPLAELLAALDAPQKARIDTANRARVQRAWEVQAATGTPLWRWQEQTPPPLLPLTAAQP